MHSDLGAPKQRRPPTVHRHLERRDNRLNIMRCSSSKEENRRFMQRQQLSFSKLQAMFFNSLGSLSPPMQWPSDIGYPKVRQSERFWTIIRMVIFLSIIFSIAIVIISTIQEEGSWTDIPGLPPSPAQVAPAFGDSGLLEVGAALPLGI